MLPPAHTATSGCPPVFVDGPQFLSLGFGCVHVFTVIYPSVLFSLVAYILCLLTDPFFSFVLVSVSFWPFNDILSSLPVELLSSSLVWAFGLWPSPRVLCSSSLSDSFFFFFKFPHFFFLLRSFHKKISHILKIGNMWPPQKSAFFLFFFFPLSFNMQHIKKFAFKLTLNISMC